MDYPLNELIDRYTIHLLKSERTSEPQTIALNEYLSAINQCGSMDDVQTYIDKLYEINGQIWDAESEIRAGLENNYGLDEIGRRALLVRDLNKKRVAIKNEIVTRFNSGYLDVKVNYA